MRNLLNTAFPGDRGQKITSLSLACMLLAVCGTAQSAGLMYTLPGEFPASQEAAKPVPVVGYDEITVTKDVTTGARQDGQAIRETVTEPYRAGLQAVATPVFNPDGTSKMVLEGTFSCPPEQFTQSSDPKVSVRLTRSYGFTLEMPARPGDRLAVRTEECGTKALPVALVKSDPRAKG